MHRALDQVQDTGQVTIWMVLRVTFGHAFGVLGRLVLCIMLVRARSLLAVHFVCDRVVVSTRHESVQSVNRCGGTTPLVGHEVP